jgi:hypothetical protein
MLDFVKQLKLLEDYGTLQAYIDDPDRIYLYQVSSFYVEVQYVYKPFYKATKIMSWECMDKLDRFIDNVDLVRYLSGYGIAPYDK